MTKKLFATAIMAASMAAIGTMGVFAESVDKVDVQGIRFEIPEDIKDLVTVETEGLDKNVLVSAYEKGSVEAAKALSEDSDGAGWLFDIITVSEDEMKDIRCGLSDGKDIFAENEDVYYVFEKPTDVRFVRETPEKMEEDQEDWTKATGWAYGAVRDDILANNPKLEAKHYSYTELDSYLNRIANKGDINYEIRTLEYPDLDASTYKGDEYIGELTDDVYFEVIEDPKDADGECIVLAFPDDNVRYEFLFAPGFENIIREVHTYDGEDGEEYITYYQATFEDPADSTIEVMKDWVNAIANGQSDDDDADEDDD